MLNFELNEILSTPVRALYEFVEFEKTINETMQVIDPEETLVIISADHSHQFTMGGYGIRASNIFGLGSHEAYPVLWQPPEEEDTSTDRENVFIINYADGPGFKLKDTRDQKDKDGNPTNNGNTCGRVSPADVKVQFSIYRTLDYSLKVKFYSQDLTYDTNRIF